MVCRFAACAPGAAVQPGLTINGGQVCAHVPMHVSVPFTSFAKPYSVRPSALTSALPNCVFPTSIACDVFICVAAEGLAAVSWDEPLLHAARAAAPASTRPAIIFDCMV